MSTIDPNSTATLNKILEKIGVKSNDDPSSLKKKDTKNIVTIDNKSKIFSYITVPFAYGNGHILYLFKKAAFDKSPNFDGSIRLRPSPKK